MFIASAPGLKPLNHRMMNYFFIPDLSRSLRRVRCRHLPWLVLAWRHLEAEDGLTLLLRRLLHHRRQLHP